MVSKSAPSGLAEIEFTDVRVQTDNFIGGRPRGGIVQGPGADRAAPAPGARPAHVSVDSPVWAWWGKPSGNSEVNQILPHARRP